MSRKHILIVTDIYDTHVDRLIPVLSSRGHTPIRLNTSDIPANTTLVWSYSGSKWEGAIRILSNGRTIDVANVRSIWWRRPYKFGLPEDLDGQEREFVVDEIQHALRGLWCSLECYWMSHPENIRRAGYKMAQLHRAAQLGFNVPRTVVTTDPGAARDFFEACAGKMVYKVLTDPSLGALKYLGRESDAMIARRVVRTTLMSDEELAILESIRSAPCQFQEYVPKRSEIRVTVIGDEIFAAEIDSQEYEESKIDWRNCSVDVKYRRTTLPEEVAEKCLALVRSYGLNFSAIDLVLTPEGRYVFLESNPNGQFLFVEDRVPALRMADALVACLVRGGNG